MRVIQSNRRKRGAALVEYGLLVAGVALVTAVAISIFGHKINDMVGTAASVLPSNDTTDTGAIAGGRIIRTTNDAGVIRLGTDTQNSTLEELYGVDVENLITDTTTSGAPQ